MLEGSRWRTVSPWTYMMVNGAPAVACRIGLSIRYGAADASHTLIHVHCKVSSQENTRPVACMYRYMRGVITIMYTTAGMASNGSAGFLPQ